MWSAVIAGLFKLAAAVTSRCFAAASDQTEVEGATIGIAKGGRSVHMVVHHSRNTTFKQWNEARVLVIQGCCRTICSFLERIEGQGWCQPAWDHVLALCSAAILGQPAPQVDTAAMFSGGDSGSRVVAAAAQSGSGGASSAARCSKEVTVAAYQGLMEMALLVCHPSGQLSVKGAKYSIGMRVIDGALREVDADPSDAVQEEEEAAVEVAPAAVEARQRLWHSAWAALMSLTGGDGLTLLAEDIDEVSGTIVDGVRELCAVGSGDDEAALEPLLCTERGAQVLRLLPTMLVSLRRAQWGAAVQTAVAAATTSSLDGDGGAVRALDWLHRLMPPRMWFTSTVERSILHVLRDAASQLHGGGASLHSDLRLQRVWTELLHTLLRFGCMDESDSIPATARREAIAALGHGAVAAGASVALPPSALSVQALQLFSTAYASQAPAEVRVAVFRDAATMLGDALRR